MRLICVRTLFLILIVLNLQLIAISDETQTQDTEALERAERWSFHFEELQIETLLNRLSTQFKPAKLAFTNVNLITMRDDQILPNQTLLVENAALALTRVMKGLLFGVSATDPRTFITVIVTLVFTALLASSLPGRRAMKTDPIAALRYE